MKLKFGQKLVVFAIATIFFQIFAIALL